MHIREKDVFAILTRSAARNAGKQVHIRWQERIDPVLGLLWRVRFDQPVTLVQFSTQSGSFVATGVELDTDAVVPDAWLMPENLDHVADPAAGELLEGAQREAWDVYVKPEVDLGPEIIPPPTPIEADLKWPDGWLQRPATPGGTGEPG